jgi:hypothetical protein
MEQQLEVFVQLMAVKGMRFRWHTHEKLALLGIGWADVVKRRLLGKWGESQASRLLAVSADLMQAIALHGALLRHKNVNNAMCGMLTLMLRP